MTDNEERKLCSRSRNPLLHEVYTMNTEIWKTCHCSNVYEVSSKGRVRSLSRKVSVGLGRERTSHGKILKPLEMNIGYLKVNISTSGEVVQHYVHDLVVNAFIELKPKGMCVNHKDGNKHNNSIDNLEIVTPSENIQHAYNYGLRSREFIGNQWVYKNKSKRTK